ncbi:TPA: hypothetical protein IX699_000284 [Enterococcus faecium]|uniref:hypothetical protein n=1 Tax=Enterococcus faecium TaxID=1352 RepID=UPI0002A44A0F|nr:hypothetical protein [Enterococcus faecium]ELB81135.1 hypothetical protein OMC_05299 [Enterococcus faecium EnGen0049]ELB81962.1 hypothetical protein OMA_04928 [Enterococcus faecium EnGen0045]MWG19297.1 hypothetical protein [Enterococcus faecium]HAQ6362156.1 hypothetical protein [Enterococcus faecium]HAQ6778936.1 hypothetical protein [Enterococcus faecium]
MLSKQEKKFIRQKMYAIIGNRLVTELSLEELQEVQKLAQLIGSNYIFDSKPLPEMTLETLTAKRYKELRAIGYRMIDIRRALRISDTKFREWRTSNGLAN